MAVTVRAVEYFHVTVERGAAEASRLLSTIAAAGVNLLVFNAVPTGTSHTELVLFPDKPDELARAVERLGLTLTAPEKALLVQGDDRLGAVAEIYAKLASVHADVYASYGVTDGRGGFGYVLYVRQKDFRIAAEALGVSA